MKARTKPFTSEKSAKSFAKVVGGKTTEQKIPNTSKSVHHVHYKSDGVYRGNKPDLDEEKNDDYASSYNDLFE